MATSLGAWQAKPARMGAAALALALLAAIFVATASATPMAEFDGNKPTNIKGVGFALSFNLLYPANTALDMEDSVLYMRVWMEGKLLQSTTMDVFADGVLATSGQVSDVVVDKHGWANLVLELSYDEQFSASTRSDYAQWVVTGGLTVIPPLVTVLVAVITREVLWALWIGVWTAAMIIYQGNPLTAFLRTLDTYMVESLGNIDHAFVILFSWFLSGLIAVVSKSGGAHGIAGLIIKTIKNKRSAQLAIYFLGFVIFFDDYANTLILGGTMRPISDMYWVAREKFAALVDCTTAPIASIAPISSWIGFELGLIQSSLDQLAALGYEGLPSSAYDVFINTIPSRYYPMYMLLLQFILILSMREFGPMLEAERRTQYTHKLNPDGARLEEVEVDTKLEPAHDTPRRWWNGVVPILVTLIAVLLGLLLTGYYSAKDAGLDITAANIFGEGDSYGSILWGAFFGSIVIWLMARFQYKKDGEMFNQFKYWIRFKAVPRDENGNKIAVPIMDMYESLQVWIEGVKGMTVPVLVLIMAWSIGQAIQDCGADVFFSSALSSDSLDYRALPTLTFLISGVISFATGTSWGTMSIVFPIAAPTAWIASNGDENIYYLTVSAILAGAVFGDHATAISDTTILSAMASKCDLQAHVITQLPYALSMGVFSTIFGYLLAGYAYDAWVGLLVGFAVVIAFALCFGVRIDHPNSKQDLMSISSEFFRTKLLKREPREVTLVPPSDKEYVDIFRANFWRASVFADFFLCRGEQQEINAEYADVKAVDDILDDGSPDLEGSTSSKSGEHDGEESTLLQHEGDEPAAPMDGRVGQDADLVPPFDYDADMTVAATAVDGRAD
ncbi:Uncharacterized protein FVE85_7654 [Porphyridium purpureum]|uniref:Na+/H+ antiporter NhaC-like C-terminal domain-containing protein n=1 Tax=Porphyridium purpureum TaxID=35688 RepID=A0A5J4Z7N6_PORPP|nr:Uncharacterized protein FVE85_7654 [Porphyridium purpureum]|eukprot:POR9293..scf295_1